VGSGDARVPGLGRAGEPAPAAPGGLQGVLARYPYDFLYGSLAADISLAKKYVPEGRHCHNWHIGEEIHATADTDRLRAVGLGYLAHLAADTVAHNFFVPRQLVLTSSTKAVGHSYWEARLDVELGDGYARLAREVVTSHDHGHADALFDRVLSGRCSPSAPTGGSSGG
jgi:hypothetical protein